MLKRLATAKDYNDHAGMHDHDTVDAGRVLPSWSTLIVVNSLALVGDTL